MANEVELKAASRRLAEEVKKVIGDDSLSASEKGSKLDKMQEESERIGAELKNVDRAKLLMGGAEAAPEEQHEAPQARSLGEAVVTHDAYKQAMVAKGGRFSFMAEVGTKVQGATSLMGEGTSGTTTPAGLSGYFLSGTAGPAILPNFLPGIVEQRFFPLSIVDLFAGGTTDSPVISYLKENSWTNNAAATNEAATMPLSTDTIGRVQEQVGKVTNMHKLTDEMIADAAQYTSFLNNRLLLGVHRQEEVQVLAGGGYPGVNGLLARSSSFTNASPSASGGTDTSVAFPTAGTPGAGEQGATIASLAYGRSIKLATGTGAPDAGTIADGLFAAITDIRFNSFTEPDAFVVNPYDWQNIRLGKDKQGQYLGGSFFGADYGNPQNAGESLWGKKAVVTPAIPQGYILTGSFRENGQVFRRQGLTVEMSNSNGTDFEQGLISVRATSRLALAVYRPGAFQLAKLVTV